MDDQINSLGDDSKPTKKMPSLGRHLFWVVLIKMILLYGLWFFFVKPNKVHLDKTDLDRLYSSQSAQVRSNTKIPSTLSGEIK